MLDLVVESAPPVVSLVSVMTRERLALEVMKRLLCFVCDFLIKFKFNLVMCSLGFLILLVFILNYVFISL